MSRKKQVLMVMPVMKGGGAERVAALLVNEFHKNGYDAEFILTSSKENEIINRDLEPDIPVIVLNKSTKKIKPLINIFYTLLGFFSSLLCKPFEFFGKTVPVPFAYLSFVSQYHSEIKLLRKKLEDNPDAAVISFLQPSIPITVLAAKGLPNKVIISERGNPERQMKKRYGYDFMKKYYQRADAVVFQTNESKAVYPAVISSKGVVIPNPVKNGLPQPYSGERNNNITTFCRISRPKNLVMLIRAFSLLVKDEQNYRLRIIGDTYNSDDEAVLMQAKNEIERLEISSLVDFEPFSNDVHNLIIKDAMYINSSDHEGMSNAMLEAMAIGMPVVCTDCPIGGAKAVINNGENGLLTEVGNAEEMYEAMKKIATDKSFSDKLSRNASDIRNELSLEATALKWMELF